MNASVAAVMREAGRAINDTFGTALASTTDVAAPCTSPVLLDVATDEAVDYVLIAEDMTNGQRVANYSVDYQDRSGTWRVLVPPVVANATNSSVGARPEGVGDRPHDVGGRLDGVGDRPDGDDPRDSHVGRKRIDVALPTTPGDVVKVRFNCIRSLEDPVYLRTFSLHRRRVPWEP